MRYGQYENYKYLFLLPLQFLHNIRKRFGSGLGSIPSRLVAVESMVAAYENAGRYTAGGWQDA